MDYFVSINCDFYHYWQTELLIESFKRHNLQDKLLIAIDGTGGTIDSCPKSLANHGRKFVFTNDQSSRHANKLYSIIVALSNHLLSSPFAWIHPDMVLFTPLKDEDCSENLIYHPTEDDPELRESLNYQNLPWMTIDGVAVFRDMPQMFFKKTFHHLIQAEKQFEGRQLAKYAWTKTIMDYIGLIDIQARQMEMELFHHQYAAPFIHYRRGMPPHFSKMNYRTSLLTLDADPFDVLVQNFPTSTASYLRDIVLSCR
jgi:hypothetical protein